MEKQTYEFISKKNNDPIVEWKTCEISGKEFAIFQSDLDFYKKISPKFKVPLDKGGGSEAEGGFAEIPSPTLCPAEREKRRLTRRNERKLYRRTCDASGKQIISVYSPDSPYKVYDQKVRRSDQRNPLDYGQDFDFDKPFFDQFDKLLKKVPLINLIGANNQNSEYINLTADSKNCYIVIESSNNEDCYYGYRLQKCKRCCDTSFAHECENCYECDNCKYCYALQYSIDCQKCDYSILLKNCTGCHHCFGCINLNQKSYCIYNKQVSKEEYEQFMSDFYKSFHKNFQTAKEKFQKLDVDSIKKYSHILNTQNCFGDYLNDAKDCVLCVDGYDAENCKYAEHVRRNAKNVMDVSTVGRDGEWIYEAINCGMNVYNNTFVAVCRSCSDMTYCYNCFNSNHCFGCIGLQNQEYCIFNKQYSKDEYEKEVGKIIGKMIETGERGEFFPSSISPFSYNETVAMEYFPIEKKEAIDRSYKRMDQETPINIPPNAQTIKGQNLPSIEELDASGASPAIGGNIVNKVVLCEVSGKPFRIIQQELDFYRKHHLPLPSKHPDIRHAERMESRTGRNFYLRNCDKCELEMLSVYPEDLESKIYCEGCYNKEIYG